MTEIQTMTQPAVLQIPASVKSLVEAMIFGAREPLTVRQLQALYEDPTAVNGDARKITYEEIARIVEELNAEYSGSDRPFRIIQIAEGYQFATLPAYAEWLGKLYKEQARRKLSQSSIETLAIIAYKQPITKPELESIRGVNCDYVIKTLLEKDLATIVGRAPTVGRPLLYGTSKEFLKHFGLNTLTDLPRPREIQEILGDSQFESERRMLEAQQGLAEEKKEEEFKSRLPHIPKRKPGLDTDVKIISKTRTREIKVRPAEEDVPSQLELQDRAAEESAASAPEVPASQDRSNPDSEAGSSGISDVPINENGNAPEPEVTGHAEAKSGSLETMESTRYMSGPADSQSLTEDVTPIEPSDVEEVHEADKPPEQVDSTDDITEPTDVIPVHEATSDLVTDVISNAPPEFLAPPSADESEAVLPQQSEILEPPSTLDDAEVSKKVEEPGEQLPLSAETEVASENQEGSIGLTTAIPGEEIASAVDRTASDTAEAEIQEPVVPQAVSAIPVESIEDEVQSEPQRGPEPRLTQQPIPQSKSRWKSWKEKIQGFIKKLFA